MAMRNLLRMKPKPRRGAWAGESVVIYFSRNPGEKRSAAALPDGRLVYVRLEVHNCDCVNALDLAQPQPGETVLNAIDL